MLRFQFGFSELLWIIQRIQKERNADSSLKIIVFSIPISEDFNKR